MRKTFALLLIILLPTLMVAQANQTVQNRPVVFRNVMLIDMTGAQPKPNMTVVVSGNRIAKIGKHIKVTKSAEIIDAAGKFLIPGLWDMHTHSREDAFTRNFIFPLDIANGVTAIRDMNGDCVNNCNGRPNIYSINQWRKEIAEGSLIGPRIYAASSPLLDGDPPGWDFAYVVKNAAEARQAVHFFKNRGVDFLKVYSLLSREAYFALADEAKKEKIVFAGHVPVSVSVMEASDAGQKSLEHMHGMQEGCSTRETELRAEMLRLLDAQVKAGVKPHLYPIYLAQAQKAFETYDASKCSALFARFVKNGTWIVPTLVDKALMSQQANDPASLLTDPRSKYLPRSVRAAPPGAINVNDAAARRLRIERYTKMVGEMGRAGVGLLAGTDLASRSPGFSVHDELSLFVEGGLTPLQALQTATINPARYFGITDKAGTIETGKFADLVLLDANPLEDIHNTQRIRAVVASGRYFSREELDKLLSAVESFADKN
jgi:imidazolonepropionase-like amidohydrolase